MTDEILVLVEHRKGEIREISFEMLAKGSELAAAHGARLTALLLGHQVSKLASAVASRCDMVELFDDMRLAHFNSDSYQQVLAPLIQERRPLLTILGHTAYGVDLAPSLATKLGAPLITDVTGIELKDGVVVAMRPVYGGKALARVRARVAGAIATVQAGAFADGGEKATPGQIVRGAARVADELTRKHFLGYTETAAEDIDITKSEIVVSVGRGIGDPEYIPMVERLAAALDGVLACSRPVVDKKWLPKSRQVGISGKVVQPALYLAVGISGAFQHLAGIRRGGMIVAINKDPNAPIIRVADYGVVDDLFEVVPALADRIDGVRTRK